MIEPYRSTKIICLQFVPAAPVVVPANGGTLPRRRYRKVVPGRSFRASFVTLVLRRVRLRLNLSQLPQPLPEKPQNSV